MRQEILNKLEALLQEEDAKVVNSVFNESFKEYKSLLANEKLNEKSLNEEQTEEELNAILEDRKLDTKIEELIIDIKEKRKAFRKKKEEEEKNNLVSKKGILKEFKDLVENEENIGAAFAKRKEIQERWKEIGNVPQNSFDEVQSQYSSLNDFFNYNINIYKAIQEHDLKKNYSYKNKIIFDLKELHNEKSMKKAQLALNDLISQWDEIGPTFQDKWEELKEEFWGNVNEMRSKIRVFYVEKSEQYAQNLELKEGLIVKANELTKLNPGSLKEWNAATEKAIELQNEWKGVGQVPKEKNQQVWDEFRGKFDDFFNRKNQFYKELKKDSSKNLGLKKDLVKKADELKFSDDWKNTTIELKKLQNQWKEIGHTGKAEQKVWEQFRAACDAFFNNKKEYYANRESIEAENLKQKRIVVVEIKKFKLPSNSNEAVVKLKEFSAKYLDIGNVPFKEKDTIYNSFKSALDVHYDNLKLDRKQKTSLNYKSKLDGMMKKGNSHSINKEKDYLKRKLNNLSAEIGQYENNIGFFGNSKGADKMIADIQKKIDRNKQEIETIKQKLKLINDAK